MKKCVIFKSNNNLNEYDYREFLMLAKTAGYEVVFAIPIGDFEIKTPTYYGKGKLLELKEIIEKNRQNPHEIFQIDCLLIDDEVTGLQKKNIELLCDIEVIDRPFIILEIFLLNAKTKEAKLQVEIALLEYSSLHLIDSSASLSQVTSGRGHNKGKGEKFLELDKRLIEKTKIKKQKELNEIKLARRNSRQRRNQSVYPKIAIVGYTNAGKSTLINALIDEGAKHNSKVVEVKDQVFATLETSTRFINIFGYPSFFITDTVGFVSRLPISLINAFRSTLEEIKEATLIIQVVDFSDPNYLIHKETTDNVLNEIGCNEIPQVILLNKYDKCDSNRSYIPKKNEIYTSLVGDDTNIKEIVELISLAIASKWDKKSILLPFSQNYNAFMMDNYVIKSVLKDDGHHCEVYINPLTKYRYHFFEE